MSKFVKKAAKGVSDIGSDVMKKTFGAMLADVVNEILEETGVTNIAKDKMMSAGYKVIKEMGIDPKNIQKELVKTALKNELKL